MLLTLQNAQCCEADKSNLPPEHKRMHNFTKVVSIEKEKNKVHVTSCRNAQCCEADKSNLPPEHKRMHKFTKVVSSEREKQSSCH